MKRGVRGARAPQMRASVDARYRLVRRFRGGESKAPAPIPPPQAFPGAVGVSLMGVV